MQMSQLHCWEGQQGQKRAVHQRSGISPSSFDFSHFLYLGHVCIVLSHPLMADIPLQWHHPSKGTPCFRLVTFGPESVLITANLLSGLPACICQFCMEDIHGKVQAYQIHRPGGRGLAHVDTNTTAFILEEAGWFVLEPF